jgi:hypothetical protein
MPSTFIPIQKVTITGPTATITFNNIPQTYTDLVIRGSIRSTRTTTTAEFLEVNFNQNTSGYNRQQLRGNEGNNTVTANRLTGQGHFNIPAVSSSETATALSPIEIYISRYAENRQRVGWVEASNSAGTVATRTRAIYAIRWTNTSNAITRIDLQPGNSFAAGSTLTLYGISNS